MKTGETGLDLIRAFEGNRLTGYLDCVGIPTIGYGHTGAAGGPITYSDGTTTSKVIVGKSITRKEANRIHASDMAKFEKPVSAAVTRKPSQHQFDAMVSLAFNIGAGAFGKSSVLRKFNAGDNQGAADAFLLWNKAGGKALAGLTRRRNAERALFLGDVALASKYVGSALPGYGAKLEPAHEDKPEESGARPDEPGKPLAQSKIILSEGGKIATLLGSISAALAGIDWQTIVALGGVAFLGFVGWTIYERIQHKREGI